MLAAQGYGTQLTLPGLTLPELLEWGTVPGHAKLLMRSFFVSAQLGCFDSSNAVPVEPMHGSSAEGARTPIEFRIQAGITNVIDSEERFVSGAQQCQCGYSALYSSVSVVTALCTAVPVWLQRFVQQCQCGYSALYSSASVATSLQFVQQCQCGYSALYSSASVVTALCTAVPVWH